MQSDVARIKPEMEFGTNSFTGRAAGPPLLCPLPAVTFENAKLRALGSVVQERSKSATVGRAELI